MRAFVIVIGVIIALVALVAAAGSYWWYRHGGAVLASSRAALSEGYRRGSTVDEAACLAETLQRHRSDRDGGMAEVISRSLWLNGCLGSSRVAPLFCEGVRPAREFVNLATWVTAACERQGVSDSGCQSIYQQVAKYCASPQRSAKVASPSRSRLAPASG